MTHSTILLLNVALGPLLGTAYAWILHGDYTAPGLESAFRDAWWTGLLAGTAIGLGATLGSRPRLSWKQSLKAQVGVILGSAAVALLWWALPKEMEEADRVLHDEMLRRHLNVSSWIGAGVGLLIQMMQVYFTRRRAAARAK
jgi:hypothetical protein